MSDHIDSNVEDYSRGLDWCPGCGRPKENGLIVCWHCWSHRDDVTPFKYAEDMDLNDWLEDIGPTDRANCVAVGV